jgi:hypothetical protein
MGQGNPVEMLRSAEAPPLRYPTPGRWIPMGFLGIVAGLAYLSWPIAYSVNRVVVERGLASDLEVPGQPFSWLFILLDIVSGVLMLGLSIAAWRETNRGDRSLRTGGLVGYGIFGLSTILSAAVPLSCGTGRTALLECGTSVGTYGWHDVLSALGYFTLFFSLAGAMGRSYRGHAGWLLGPLVTTVGLLWCAAGIGFLLITLSHHPEVTAQHVLLLLTTVVIGLVPLTLERRRRPTEGEPRGDTPP